MARHQRPILAANWKMNNGPTAASAFLASFLASYARRDDRTVILFPSALAFAAARSAVAEHPQPFKIVAENGILHPHEREPGLVNRGQLDQRLLGAPRLVGVDHHQRALADRLAQQLKAMQVAVEVRMANLYFERVISERRRMSEEFAVLAVAEMKIEPGRVNSHALPPATQKAV